MHLTGKHINYFHICHRKLWLFDHGVSFQQTHEHVQDGTLLHLTAYPQRAKRFREVQLGGIKIDFYDPVDRVVHEIKRSDKMEAASVAQLQYYLRVLERLVDHFEERMPEPRRLFGTEADAAYAARIVAGTVGFRLRVRRLTAKSKLSQNKPAETVARILVELDGDGPFASPALAAEMRRVHGSDR